MPSKSATQALPQQWRQHIEDWRNSGLSQQAFCRDRSLSYHKYHYWRKKLAQTPINKTQPRFSALVPIAFHHHPLTMACLYISPMSSPDSLLVIGDTRSLEIETYVLSADAVKIKPGMRVEIHRWGGEKSLEGQVRLVEPVGFTKVSALGVEEQRVLVISDIPSESSQWQSLGYGYRVEAEYILREADDVL